jgi:hypothetical protein
MTELAELSICIKHDSTDNVCLPDQPPGDPFSAPIADQNPRRSDTLKSRLLRKMQGQRKVRPLHPPWWRPPRTSWPSKQRPSLQTRLSPPPVPPTSPPRAAPPLAGATAPQITEARRVCNLALRPSIGLVQGLLQPHGTNHCATN